MYYFQSIKIKEKQENKNQSIKRQKRPFLKKILKSGSGSIIEIKHRTT